MLLPLVDGSQQATELSSMCRLTFQTTLHRLPSTTYSGPKAVTVSRSNSRQVVWVDTDLDGEGTDISQSRPVKGFGPDDDKIMIIHLKDDRRMRENQWIEGFMIEGLVQGVFPSFYVPGEVIAVFQPRQSNVTH